MATQTELWVAYKDANIKLTQMFYARDYDAFNEYRHVAIELFEQLNNPFEVGDTVEYKSGRQWVRTVITEIYDNSRVVTKDYIAPFTSFRFPVEEVEIEQEQLSLFS